jgi:hypothetical protein
MPTVSFFFLTAERREEEKKSESENEINVASLFLI